MTAPVPPGDREALVALIQWHSGADDPSFRSPEDAADAILARWQLVPVDAPRQEKIRGTDYGDEETDQPAWAKEKDA